MFTSKSQNSCPRKSVVVLLCWADTRVRGELIMLESIPDHPHYLEEEESPSIYNGPVANGGGANASTYVFNLLDTKNERIVIYVCMTIIAVCYIVWG